MIKRNSKIVVAKRIQHKISSIVDANIATLNFSGTPREAYVPSQISNFQDLSQRTPSTPNGPTIRPYAAPLNVTQTTMPPVKTQSKIPR